MGHLITVSQPDFGPYEFAAVQAVLASYWVVDNVSDGAHAFGCNFRGKKEFSRPVPVTEELAKELISLPLHTRLSASQVDQISGPVKRFLRHSRPPAARRKPLRLKGAVS